MIRRSTSTGSPYAEMPRGGEVLADTSNVGGNVLDRTEIAEHVVSISDRFEIRRQVNEPEGHLLQLACARTHEFERVAE